MKKVLYFTLVSFVVFLLCACGNIKNNQSENTYTDDTPPETSSNEAVSDSEKIVDAEQEYMAAFDAYSSLNFAYNNVLLLSSDLLRAWDVDIEAYTHLEHSNSDSYYSVDYFSNGMSWTVEKVIEAISYYGDYRTGKDSFGSKSAEEKAAIIEEAVANLNMDSAFPADYDVKLRLFKFSLEYGTNGSMVYLYTDIVRGYYYELGINNSIDTTLSSAKSKIKELYEKYPNSEYYQDLKDYYTTIDAFYKFCDFSSISYIQAMSAVLDYRTKAETSINNLEWLFD